MHEGDIRILDQDLHRTLKVTPVGEQRGIGGQTIITIQWENEVAACGPQTRGASQLHTAVFGQANNTHTLVTSAPFDRAECGRVVGGIVDNDDLLRKGERLRR
nr:hypothetical protein [Nocardia pseudobrasiliensis]